MGRRIYVHEYTFADFAQRHVDLSRPLVRGLLQVSAAKTVRRQVVEDGLGMRMMTEEEADANWSWSEQIDYSLLNSCFRGLRLRRKRSADGSSMSLLGHHESIVSSCQDDGYFTFATDAAASTDMFADKVPMKQLRVENAAGNNIPRDLTLVRGRALAPLMDTESENGDAVFSRKAARACAELDAVLLSEQAVIDGWLVEKFKDALSKSTLSDNGRKFVEDKLGVVRKILPYVLDNFACEK